MVPIKEKSEWWGISKLEIIEPTSNPSHIYCNGLNRVTLSIYITPITKDHNIIEKEYLSDEEIKRNIILIDAIEGTPLLFNEFSVVSTHEGKWGYTDNISHEDAANKFVKIPYLFGHRHVSRMAYSEPIDNGTRKISYNIYCNARSGGTVKKIAVKIMPTAGETITSLNGPSTSGAGFITLLTLTPLEYKPEHIQTTYYPPEIAQNACDTDGSDYRIVELGLNSSDFKLVASEIFGNNKTAEDIKKLNDLFFDNVSEFPWIHRVAVLPEGAYSYYCWGFDHIPEESNTDHSSKDNPYNLGRGHSYCYVKINEIFRRKQEKFFILIIYQSKSGSSKPKIRDIPIKIRLYDQYGNKGEFQLKMGENLHVEGDKKAPGVTLSAAIIS